MAIEDKIIKLEPDDIISDSMNKINHNFRIIESEYSGNVFEEKLQNFSKKYEKELEDLRSNCNSDNANILNSINNLSDKVYTIYDNNIIQDAVNNAILNADQELINFIWDKAGEQIDVSMNDYAKKSSLNELSSAFTQYKADEKTKQASVNTIVSNNRYCRDSEGRLCYLNGTSSGYKTLEEYYANGLSTAEKATVNGSSTDGLSDPDVLERFLKLCETTFKTEFKELSSIISSVSGGVSKTSIVSAVRGSRGSGEDEDIVAAIFVEANEGTGSQISLNADKIAINSTNFTIDPSTKKVIVKGELEATSLKIKNSDSGGTYDISDTNKLATFVNGLIPQGGDESYTYPDAWLRKALGETEIAGGLIVTGDLLALDSNENITAGVIGANDENNEDDVKFFAGTTNISSSSTIEDIQNAINEAPFRVLENGTLYSTKAKISGEITANGLTVGDKIFIGRDNTYGNCIKIIDNNDNLSVLSSDKLIINGSFVYKTAYLVGDLGFWGDDEESEILKNLQETYDIYSTDDVEDLFTKYDIINVCLNGDVILPNNPKYIGRKITFMHGHPLSNNVVQIVEDSGLSYSYSLGGSYCDCKFTSGSNCKFYEDGGKSSTLHLSNEAVEMIGVGIGNTFMGFIISKRYNITTEKEYGHELRCLGMFKVTTSGSTPSVTSKTYSNQTATIAKSGDDYVITTPFYVGSSTDNFVVSIVAEGSSGITYGYTLGTASSKLKITIKSSNISNTFKVMVFNFGDFGSLRLDAWTN